MLVECVMCHGVTIVCVIVCKFHDFFMSLCEKLEFVHVCVCGHVCVCVCGCVCV